MDFSKYVFKLNLKSCCLYEQISGNNFLKLSTEEDVLLLVYCCLVVNNPSLLMTFKVFQTLMADKKVSQWLIKQYEKVGEFNAQIKVSYKEEKEEGKKENE